MNKSELFKAAHKLAKSVIKSGDNYRVTFGAAIKATLSGFVSSVEKTIARLTKWNKNGEHRVYINIDNDDVGYMLVVGEAVDFSKVEAKFKSRVIAAVEKRTAKLQESDSDYTAADAVKGAAGLTF